MQMARTACRPLTCHDGRRATNRSGDRANDEIHLWHFGALGLVLLGIGAFFAARVASPIIELIRATERVAQGKLSTRVPVTREDEIGDLMRAFNTMTQESIEPGNRRANRARTGMEGNGTASRSRNQKPAYADEALGAAFRTCT